MGKATIPTAALDQHVAILGKTGSGKTFAAKGVVERLLAEKRQVCVLDPTSAWWGLRLGADGKGRGFDVVLLGGEHGDIPLSERSGPAVARLVTEQGASVVIDTGGMTVGEYTRWFIDFSGTLYTTVKNPLHLVIDEAHYFMPQARTLSVDGGKMLHAGNRLMSGGRSRGIRGMMITQRPAKLHKDSLTCADTLVAMRMVGPQDRAAVKEWIDGAADPARGKAVLDSLAGLSRGEGWVWYPEGSYLERVTFPPIKTFDSSAAPKHGQGNGPTVTAINLDEVKAAMADAVREAEANDPKMLKAEIARLRKELATRAPAADPARLAEEYARGVADENRRWTAGVNGYGAELQRHGAATVKVGEALAGLVGAVTVLPPPRIVSGQPRVASPPRVVVSRPARIVSSGGSLAKGERIVLTAVAQHDGGADRAQITVLTGYKRSTRDAYIQRLREAGHVETNGDNVVATDAGIVALGSDYEPLPTGEALRDYWIGRLPEGERKCLEALLPYYPDYVPRDDLDNYTGYKRSTRDAYLQRLTARKLIESQRGEVRAAANLFD